MAHIIAIKGHSLKCPPPAAPHFSHMPTLHGGNRAAYTRFGFRDFYAFFGIFIYSFLLLTRHRLLVRYHIIYCIPFSATFSCWSYVCRYAIKPTGPIKTQLNFFSPFQFFPSCACIYDREFVTGFCLFTGLEKPFFLYVY